MCLKSTTPTSDKGALLDYRHPREMDFPELRKLLEEHADYLCIVHLHGGEPLRYRNIVQLVELLNELKIPFNIITNGSLLTEQLCKKLVGGYCFSVGVSLDAASEETYRYIRRGGELSRVLSNLKRINTIKDNSRSRRPILSASMCTFAANIGEVSDLIQICHDYNIPSLTVGEGFDYDTNFTKPSNLARNNKELFRRELFKAQAKAKQLGVILRLRFPFLADDAESTRGLPRQVGTLLPKSCLNLYASVWRLPNLDAIGCSVSPMSWGSVKERGLDAVWNGPDGTYVIARRDLRNEKVPLACEGCVYTGRFLS
jgi:MoaA/NifB/PqqE/SkfB family radical SAM enzyme